MIGHNAQQTRLVLYIRGVDMHAPSKEIWSVPSKHIFHTVALLQGLRLGNERIRFILKGSGFRLAQEVVYLLANLRLLRINIRLAVLRGRDQKLSITQLRQS